MIRKQTIAYLAPEIPALSATFVYNEILSMERFNFQIVPISVHFPQALAREKGLEELTERTIYLYRTPFFRVLGSNIIHLFKAPFRYLSTFCRALRDALHEGMTGHVGKGLMYRFLIASHVSKLMKKKGCTHLHAHFAHIPTDIAMYASQLSNIPYSFTAHANDLFERRWLIQEKVERAKEAVTISRYNRNFMASLGADESKIRIVRCGVDSKKIPALPPTEREDRRIPVIGTLARLVEKKGVDTLILAMARLKVEGFDFWLEIAGEGPMLVALQELVSTQELAGKVRFLGAIQHDAVFKWFRHLDLFVLACKKDQNGDQDGIPVVLMEAMAMGIPTLSTNLSGIPELIEEGKTGLLANPDDPGSLAKKIRYIFRNPSETLNMVNRAKERIATEFDADVNIERMIRLFKGVNHE